MKITTTGGKSIRRLGLCRCILLAVVLSAWSASARVVDITIVHTTDLHGHLLPTADYDGVADVGGFLRVASRIEELRRQDPDLLLVDCGDLFQGSPASYLDGGRVMMDALDVMKYDAWTLGNHEFDWGIEQLAELQEQTDTPILAANIYVKPGEKDLLPRIRPFRVVERKGLRIAVIGLITPGVPSWSRPHLIHHTLFADPVESLAKLMPAVREARPDLIILTTHQGYKRYGDDHANHVGAIARAFPDIDVIIGGHTHEPVGEARIGDVLYTQAGYHGIWVGIASITYDTVRDRVIGKQARVERMDASVPFHPELHKRWEPLLTRTRAYLDEPVGRAEDVLKAELDSLGQSPVQQLICRAIADASGADIVIHGTLSDASVKPGPLTREDVWEIVPYENTIGVAHLLPSEIAEILEETLGPTRSYRRMGAYGCMFDITRDSDGAHVDHLRGHDGEPLHARKRYKVAFNSYALASGGTRFPVLRRIVDRPESRLDMIDADTRHAVETWIRKQKVVSLDTLDLAEPVAP